MRFAGQFDDTDLDGPVVNTAYRKRFDEVKLSKSVHTMQNLYLDFCQTGNVIPSCARIQLVLTHAADAHRLMCPQDKAGQYKLLVEKVDLIVTQVRVSHPNWH